MREALGSRNTWMCLYFLWRAAMISPSSVHAVASRASCGKVSSSITKLWYLAAVKGLSMEAKDIVSNRGQRLSRSSTNRIKKQLCFPDKSVILLIQSVMVYNHHLNNSSKKRLSFLKKRNKNLGTSHTWQNDFSIKNRMTDKMFPITSNFGTSSISCMSKC